MTESGGEVSLATRWRLAQKAFATTAAYDSAIAATLAGISLDGGEFRLPQEQSHPAALAWSLRKVMDLRYGENPHQSAALYSGGSGTGVANGRPLQGKELSFNNIVDPHGACDLAQEFNATGYAILTHTNPCGTAI